MANKNQIKWERGLSEGAACWKTKWATVWDNGVWFTWDKDGCGGENGIEVDVQTAKAWAIMCAIRQGFLEVKQ